MTSDPTILILLEPNDEAIAAIRTSYPRSDIRLGPMVGSKQEDLPRELMVGVEILLCEYPPGNFREFDSLKWMQITSHGYAQVFDLPLLKRGIRVSNGLGNFDIPIAEWNIMMISMWHRHMLEMLQNQKDRIWDRAAKFQSELRGAVVGFYGYGGIARQTARLAKAMGMVVWALQRNESIPPRHNKYCVQGTGDPDGICCDLAFGLREQDDFFEGVDYLLLTLPLTKATEGLIGEDQLRLLKPSAVLINPGRAHLVQEEVLIRCMRERWIRGASLDVHYAYPLPQDHPLWSMADVILTPHISGSSDSPHYLERIYDIFIQNLKRFRADGPLLNELTPNQLRGC